MKRALKVSAYMLVFLFVISQFYQPVLNKNEGQVDSVDFMQSYAVPQKVNSILRSSCYDCHSNNTHYVWYDHIQPVRFLVEGHIKDAKEALNFSEWGTYSERKQERLLTSIIKQIDTGQMPLPSYTLMHRDAKLNTEKTKILIHWLKDQE